MCIGLGCHSSSHPCPYCEAKARIWEPPAPLRSLESVKDNYYRWQTYSGKKTELKDYLNCAHVPIIQSWQESESTLILKIAPPPTLHLKLGIVNKLMAELFLIDPKLEEFLAREYHIIRQEYHGMNYEGNSFAGILLIHPRQYFNYATYL